MVNPMRVVVIQRLFAELVNFATHLTDTPTSPEPATEDSKCDVSSPSLTNTDPVLFSAV